MRPVKRGPWPLKSDGTKESFDDYGRARRWLYIRIGVYCSYCNQPIVGGAVEHVRPKKPAGVAHPDRERDWDNFLLACSNCNSHKGDVDVELAEYFWPHRDNTMRAFQYESSGRVRVADDLKGTKEEPIAQKTIALTGLDHVPKLDPSGNVPTTESDPCASDMRYERRRTVWKKAEIARQRLISDPSPERIADIISLVEEAGCWPIWFRHLADLPGMREELLKTAGTDAACFGPSGELLPRPGGQL